MLCIPKANHKKLIDECYPPPKNLASVGPEYKPNKDNLGRLAYYANRKPEKLVKVGRVLEQKASATLKGLGASDKAADKAKGGLMITLGIVQELVTECHRDINYFASSAAFVIDVALQGAQRSSAGRRDLDLTSRSAATFYALSNYLNSSSGAIDAETSRLYANLLGQFAKIAVEERGAPDHETLVRIRLLGVGALAGAIGSDAFYAPNYNQQLSVILPALLSNVDSKAYNEDPEGTQSEAEKIAQSGSPSNDTYSAKRVPVNARRVPNFAIDTEKAPTSADVASAAMGNIHAAVHNGDASHVQGLVTALINFFNGKSGTGSRQWANKEWCCWITQAICSWTALQYRFIIPTQLVEYLAFDADGPTDEKHHTLTAIITALLGGKLSMIGLSTSDTTNNLLGFAVRRVHLDQKDPILPPLVNAVGSLGAHVYYADQLNDIAEEITARITTLEMPQIATEGGAVSSYSENSAAKESIRMLLGCLVKLMAAAQQGGGQVQKGSTGKASPKDLTITQAGVRSRISSAVFTQTSSLLASPDNWVRQSFEETLLAYLANEVQPVNLDKSDPSSDNFGAKVNTEAVGFTHSLSAAIYVLTTSKTLLAPATHKNSPLEALPFIDRANKETQVGNSANTVAALPIDYSAVIQILNKLIEKIPIASVLGVVPALLAMSKTAGNLSEPQQDAVNIVVKSALNKAGEVCGVSSVQKSVSTSHLPAFPPTVGAKPMQFSDLNASSKAGSISASSVASSLSGSSQLQKATGLDAKALQSWFERDWSVQIAVDDSFIGASPFNSDDLPTAGSRFLSPMTDNVEQPPVMPIADATPGASADTSGVGVEDFRQALGHRTFGKADFAGAGAGLNGIGEQQNGLLGLPNGGSTSLDKRASRRASRKISQPLKLASSGQALPDTVGGLLDSMKVGLPEEDATPSSEYKSAPYVP